MKVDERELDRVAGDHPVDDRRGAPAARADQGLAAAADRQGLGHERPAVNQLVKQFDQMRKVMKQIGRGKMPDLGALMRQAR